MGKNEGSVVQHRREFTASVEYVRPDSHRSFFKGPTCGSKRPLMARKHTANECNLLFIIFCYSYEKLCRSMFWPTVDNCHLLVRSRSLLV